MEDQIKPSPVTRRGTVKQVLSGDSFVILEPALQGPPKEITLFLSPVLAPRLAKRPIDGSSNTNSDEPYAWEAREFLRKKIVGKNVVFECEFITKEFSREHGKLSIGEIGAPNYEDIVESGVSEGLLEVRSKRQLDEYTQELLDLQEKAKSAKKGRWSNDPPEKHVRSIKWTIEDPKEVIEKYSNKEVDAVVEQVRDGSTIRAFLLPTFEYVTIALSGIRAPAARIGNEGKPEEYGEEAKFFVEIRLLQRDVKVKLEGALNQNLVGSVLHPRGNIAEFLLKGGYAKCMDRSLSLVSGGAQPLREAENYAKQNRLRLWKNYTPPKIHGPSSQTAKVVEIGLGDSIYVLNDKGEEEKIFFSSLRPLRRDGTSENPQNRQFRPLFDTPFLFEAREFIRKKIIGKRVTLLFDYKQPKSEQFPEKTCYTVLFNNTNIAEALVAKGLGRVIRHRNDDENRSSHYEALLDAETNAEKEKLGVWGKSDENNGIIRIQELQGDLQRSKQFLPYLQRSTRLESIVEFVTSGSRLRVYVPKETVIITFLLAGIDCPRSGARRTAGVAWGAGTAKPADGDLSDEAMKFTRSLCMHRDVQIEVESLDRVGSFIGYMFIPSEKGAGGTYRNLSELLVENGFASVHFTAERSSYYSSLVASETKAKEGKLGIWQNYEPEETNGLGKQNEIDEKTERAFNYKKVLVSEVHNGLRFSAQLFDDGPAIESLMNNLQIELKAADSGSPVKRGQLAAAQFAGANNLWHRVRIEAVRGQNADVHYVDFGNRETIPLSRIAPLPAIFQSQQPLAKEYQMAFAAVPSAQGFEEDAKDAFARQSFSQPYYLINTEYKLGGTDAVTLYFEDKDGKKIDVGKELILEGNAVAEKRREKRFQSLCQEYEEAEKEARSKRRSVWRYGDFTGVEM